MTIIDGGYSVPGPRDRVVVEVEGAGFLARGRTDAAGEFRKVVGRVQDVECTAPIVLVDQVVPVRDDVVDWATLMAEGDAAIHATGALLRDLLMVHRDNKLAEVPYAVAGRRVLPVPPVDLQKPGNLAHYSPPAAMLLSDAACWAICISCRARR